MNDLRWQLNKFYEANEAVFELKIRNLNYTLNSPLSHKNFILTLNAHLNTDNCLSLFSSRKHSNKINGAFANIFRKYIKTIYISSIKKLENSDIWISLSHSKRDVTNSWFIGIINNNPKELVLLDSNLDALVRKSKKGTFTKKKSFFENQTKDKFINTLNQHECFATSLLTNNNLNKEIDLKYTSNVDVKIKDSSSLPTKCLKSLKRRLKTLKKSALKNTAQTPSNKELNLIANNIKILEANIHNIPQGAFIYKEIELDPELSVGLNIQKQYILLKKKTRAFKIGNIRLQELNDQIYGLEQDIVDLQEKDPSDFDLDKLLVKYSLKSALKETSKTKKKILVTKSYHTFKVGDNLQILVGKSARDNDTLVKNAKGNDHWLHVVNTTGSHIIISKKNDLKPKELRQAGILAIHFSKLRKDCAAEVYVSKKRFLSKKKGMPAGLWNIEKASSIFIRYDRQELDEILDRS